MRSFTAVVCIVLLWGSAGYGGVGDVRYVEWSPDADNPSRVSLLAHGQNFAKPSEGAGTVNPHAVVAWLYVRRPDERIAVAIDSKAPDTERPDVLRLDLSGKGKFDGAYVAPMERRGSGSWSIIGPVTFQVKRDEATIPFTVMGRYHKSGSYRQVTVEMGTAVEASCRFGDKTYPVRILDGTNNLSVTDVPRIVWRGGRIMSGTAGDRIAVDVGDGSFRDRMSVRKAYYGHPILVDGAWYKVALSGDGKKMAAEALGGKTGQFKIAHGEYRVILVGDKQILEVSGGAEPAPAPEGRYTVLRYTELVRRSGVRGEGRLECGRGAYGGKRAEFVVAAGKTTDVEIGAPLTAMVAAQQRGQTVSLSLVLRDASGMAVDDLTVPGRGQPPEPTYMIRDAAGKLVHSGKMSYG